MNRSKNCTIEKPNPSASASPSQPYTKNERTQYLRVARGSMTEAENWIQRAYRRGLLTDDMDDRVSEAHRLLNGLLKRPM